jgi:hypothetical protein
VASKHTNRDDDGRNFRGLELSGILYRAGGGRL